MAWHNVKGRRHPHKGSHKKRRFHHVHRRKGLHHPHRGSHTHRRFKGRTYHGRVYKGRVSGMTGPRLASPAMPTLRVGHNDAGPIGRNPTFRMTD